MEKRLACEPENVDCPQVLWEDVQSSFLERGKYCWGFDCHFVGVEYI